MKHDETTEERVAGIRRALRGIENSGMLRDTAHPRHAELADRYRALHDSLDEPVGVTGLMASIDHEVDPAELGRAMVEEPRQTEAERI